MANFLQNHLFLWIKRMNLPKRDYRKTALGGLHKGICKHNSEVLMMLLTKEKGVPQALANP